ncbi:hypothetical protein [Herbaspirillum sp. CF444]|uniref:hypothetical protein n=1 Tax=Herbaspirillum sp. CF444 TaxID=1144319 RepID=UPI0012F9C742|nr:hypothetical protein [Herbaspirillum sp. CF444]
MVTKTRQNGAKLNSGVIFAVATFTWENGRALCILQTCKNNVNAICGVSFLHTPLFHRQETAAYDNSAPQRGAYRSCVAIEEINEENSCRQSRIANECCTLIKALQIFYF